MVFEGLEEMGTHDDGGFDDGLWRMVVVFMASTTEWLAVLVLIHGRILVIYPGNYRNPLKFYLMTYSYKVF